MILFLRKIIVVDLEEPERIQFYNKFIINNLLNCRYTIRFIMVNKKYISVDVNSLLNE